MPNWDVQINAPIVNKSYSLWDVVTKDSIHLVDPSQTKMGLLYYHQDTTLKPVLIGDKLKINPLQTSSSVALGKIALNTPPTYSTQLTFKDLLGVSVPATQTIIPPFSQSAYSSVTINEFQIAWFDNGTMNITLTNNLGPFTINVTRIRILDGDGVSELASSTASLSLANGSSGTVKIPLAGVMLTSSMRVEVTVNSPGSGSLVTIPSNSNLSIQVQMQNLDPRSVTANIPQQDTATYQGSFSLDNDANSSVQQIVVSSGTLNFTVQNNFQVSMAARFIIPGLVSPTGAIFDESVPLTKGQKTTITKVLDGWSINASANTLSYTAKAVVPATNSATLSKTDNIGVTVAMGQLTLRSLKGKIKTTQLDLNSTVLDVKLGNLNNFKATLLHFNNFGLSFNVGSSPSLKLGFQGKVVGSNSTKKDSITIPATVLAGSGTKQTITLDPTQLDHFISSFSSAPPDFLTISYNATVNPNPSASDPAGQITSADSIFGGATINAPLDLGISGGTVTDTVNVDINNSDRKDLNQIKSILVTFNIVNNIPASVTFSGMMYDANNKQTIPFPPVDTAGGTINPSTIVIPASGVGSDRFSDTSQAGKSAIQLLISGGQVQQMLNSKKMIITLAINTALPNASPVKFRTSDGIKVYATGQLNYTVQP